MFSTKLILSCAAVLIATGPMNAQDMFFSGLSVGDGLSQYTVRDIAQDGAGMLWIATADGLNRFDGYDFKVFRHNSSDSTSLADNHLQTLAVDADSHVWVGSASFLSEFNPLEERFYNHPSPSSVTALAVVDEQRILVGLSSGLYFFIIPSNVWEPVIENIGISSIRRTQDRFLIGTGDGRLFQMPLNTLQCRALPDFQATQSIQDIFFEEPDRLWVATEGHGLIQADAGGHFIRHFTSASGLASDFVRSLATDSFGRLWVGTVNGLDIISEGRIHHEGSNPFVRGTISHNSVRCIFRDNQDGMWLGTFYGGLNYWHPLRNHFGNIEQRQDGKSLSDDIISCIVEDGPRIWLGTNGGGVNCYDRKSGRISVVPVYMSGRDNAANDIKAIYAGSDDGHIYVGAHSGGLRRIRRTDLSVSHCGGEDSPVDVYSLLPMADGSLLVGSLGGLYAYSPGSDTFARLHAEPDFGRVWTLQQDSSGLIWAGTENGVRVFSFSGGLAVDERREHSEKLAGLQKPVCVHIGASSFVWIASQDGAACYDVQEGTVRMYTVAEGLPGNVTHGIEEDDWGRIWISTDRGLCCLNPFTGQIRSYSCRDGLSSDQFTDYSHCRLSNGEMWFGGMHGVNFFQPEKFSDNPFSPKPVISSLMVAEQPFHISDGTVKLSYNQNSLVLNFTVPNYLAWGESRFRYLLEGYSDSSWVNAGDDRRAVFSNLSPGRYVFKVQAANNDGQWCDDIATLNIRITPKWTQTIAARIAFILLILILISLALWFVSERAEMNRKIEYEEQEKVRQEEMMQMKTRFFINMSHELRNPLQLILAPISEMQSRTDDRWMRKQLRYLDRNANRLLHLVNQLMDYRRAELGVFKLHVRPENLHKIIRENFSYFENLASSKHLSYELDSQIEGQELLCDDQYIELILNNLLSNAFKYTDNGGVKVIVAIDGDELCLSVADTGIGVAKEEQDRIFERFYQADDNHVGSGIGLSLVQRLVELHHGRISLESEPGTGSVFTVRIPIVKSAYSEEELAVEQEEKHSINHPVTMARSSMDVNEKEAQDITPDRPSLLIVEDDTEIRTYLEQGLEGRFLTESVSNGREAVDKLTSNTYDLVLTDVNMPLMNGRELCAWIRHNPQISNLPVIVVSSLADDEAQLELLHTGADDYVTKPFSVAVLNAKLSNLLKAKKKLKATIEGKTHLTDTSVAYSPADEDFLARALKVVDENLSNVDFSTEDLAAAMNMSRSSLHLKIKSVTGSSALDLIRKYRFDKACEMLEAGRLSVSEISYMVGFSSASYFTTSFKKQLGCLPSEYVKRNAKH